LIPRPVKLTHYISEAHFPPQVDINDEEAFNNAVDQWHAGLTTEMNRMLMEHRKK